VNFCSRAAQAGENPLPGSAARGAAYVLLPVGKQLWGERELNRTWASPAELEAMRQARRDGGVVTRLYNPPRDPLAGEAAVLVYPGPDAGGRTAEALEGLLAAFHGRWPVDATGARRLAICTQGTRDRCCAKWGFAVYQAARRLHQAGASAFEPLECSHLGGDRFAATGVFFPSGSMYGHLDSIDLAAVAAAEAAGALAPGPYRGRVYESELTQVVRAGLARDGHGADARAPIEILTPTPLDGEVEVALAADGRRFSVGLASIETRFFSSCEALEEGKASRARRLVYVGARALQA
jgi:hypothetical protein